MIIDSTEGNIGIPIGNQSSQLFALLYLNNLLQFALHIVLATVAHLPDYCARFGQIRMKAQEINTVSQRVNVRFVVQR